MSREIPLKTTLKNLKISPVVGLPFGGATTRVGPGEGVSQEVALMTTPPIRKGVGEVPEAGAGTSKINEMLPPQKEGLPVGGRLQQFWDVWHRNHAPPSVVEMLKEGYILPFKDKNFHPPLTNKTDFSSSYRNTEKNSALLQAVQDLLEKNAIEEVKNPSSLGFYSRMFLVPKKDSWRPIIDLSHLNQFLEIPKFKMETPESVRKELQKGDWITSVDLTDAYLHIPIHKKSRKYLRFKIGDKIYQFKVLPFGLATAPYLFTKLVKAMKEMALKLDLGLDIYQYLDDWINRTLTFQDGLEKVQVLLKFLKMLGFLVDMKKIPTKTS